MCEQVSLNRFLPEIQLCSARPARSQSSPPWEGVTRSLIAVAFAAAFAAAFRSWLEHCKKCVCLGGEFTEKSKETSS